MYMYCGNEHSQGGKALASALNIRRIRHTGSRFMPDRTKTVVNWGAAGDNFPLALMAAHVINHPAAVLTAANKLLFFERCAEAEDEPRTPHWETSRDRVRINLDRGDIWVARQTLTGHSGRGIIIMERPDQFVQAPLYTKYIKKHEEYRVHIVRGEIIDVQRKVRDPDREPTNWQVRSHQNGFIYQRGGIKPSPDVHRQALLAFEASGLDFGAVDVITKRDGTAYVLEINTAPGLTGQTVQNYAQAFRRL